MSSEPMTMKPCATCGIEVVWDTTEPVECNECRADNWREMFDAERARADSLSHELKRAALRVIELEQALAEARK